MDLEKNLMDADDMGSDLQKILLIEAQIQNRLAQIAAVIDQSYVGHEILLVGVLRGAVMVMTSLAHKLHTSIAMDWMTVFSYGSRARPSGVVRILKDSDTDIRGRHVLTVEGIIDSDLTLSWLEPNLRGRGCASLNIAALLREPGIAETTISSRYVGFDIPNEFVVGCGLDYVKKYRNLPFVGLLAPHVCE